MASRRVGGIALFVAVATLAACGEGGSSPRSDTRPTTAEPTESSGRRQPAGRTYFVAPRGSDSNPGTAEQPWRTIQGALDRLQPGQTALVGSGMYAPARCEPGHGGSAQAGYVTIKAAPRQSPVLRGAVDGVLKVACDYLAVDGLTIAGPGTVGGTLVYGTEESDHVDLVDNEIRGSICQAIFLDEETDDWRILRNWIHDNGSGCDQQAHGIYLQGDDHLVANNLIEDQPEGYGIQAYDYNSDAKIANNTIVHSGRGGIVVGGEGCRSGGACGVSRIEIANNVVAFNSTYGIVANTDGPKSCDIHANLAFENGDGSYSGGWPAGCMGSNGTADPRFASGSYRVASGSPAVDSGDPTATVSPDRDGVARPQGSAPDIGAYELRAG